MKKLYIISGTTKGLGLDLLKQCLENGDQVLSLSRTKPFDHPAHSFLKMDFKKKIDVSKTLLKKLNLLSIDKFEQIIVIHNAAAIEPIGDLTTFEPKDIFEQTQINFVMPTVITQTLCKLLKRKKTSLINCFISSGASVRPLPAWSLYCSSKAALRMMTECLGVDYAHRPEWHFLDFSPGVMDTQMQKTIRKQPQSKFSRVNDFKKLKENNQLLPPSRVASILLDLLNNKSKITKQHFSVDEFL
jgi:benzil reductase ((S)-benzoin forming)